MQHILWKITADKKIVLNWGGNSKGKSCNLEIQKEKVHSHVMYETLKENVLEISRKSIKCIEYYYLNESQLG